MLVDRDGRIRFINRTAEGLTVDEVIGTMVYGYLPENQHESMRTCFDDVVKTREPGRFDSVYSTGEGRTSHWETRVGPILEGDAVTGFVLFSSNVSARHDAALERDRIFALSFDMLGIVGLDGYFTRINPAFRKTLGYTEAELLEKPFFDLAHPDDRNAARAAFLRVVDEATGVVRFESRFLTKNEEPRVIQWVATRDPDSRRAITVARDVTDQRALEAQLLQSQKMDAIGQLAGGIAHDFNNLLLSILGNVHLARNAGEETKSRLDEIQAAADRAADLTKQLLAFGRRQALVRTTLDVNAQVRELTKLLRRLIPASIDIELITSPDLSAIEADRSQVEQIVMNLCVNARDAMPNGGCISIETADAVFNDAAALERPWAKPGRYVRISVTDSGEGIAPAVRGKIFEPFFTTKARGEGTGLGLSTVYGAVQQHRGLLHVDSDPGRGTRIEVYLPASERRPSSAPPPPVSASAAGRETILVAEDEGLVRKVVVGILEHAGYTVIAVSNGREAVNICRERDDLDLVLLDVVMPVLNGPAAALEIRKLCPDLPILFSSGYNAESHFFGALPFDAVVLVKPYGHETLLNHVRAMVDGRTIET
jgi:hypothetical protein